MTTVACRVLDPSPAPGTTEWLGVMTASKVAAVIGWSPWESRFSLWHKMAGLIVDDEVSEPMIRGTILEPSVRDYFRYKNPGLRVEDPTGMWVRDDLPWAGATPDGLICQDEPGPVVIYTGERSEPIIVQGKPDIWPVALLECKTATDRDAAWGTPGTAEIPDPYICQVQWQMHITGIKRTYLAVLFGNFEFKIYVIEYDPVEAEALVKAAREFMDTLPGRPGEQRPDIDAHSATYQAVRKLHPDIDPDESVEIGAELAAEFLRSAAALAAADKANRYAKTQILDLMGDARIGTAGGINVVRRQPAGKAIALHAIKTKPIPIQEKEAA